MFQWRLLEKYLQCLYNADEKILNFEESKGNNYVFVSVLALYHQKCIFKKENNTQCSNIISYNII